MFKNESITTEIKKLGITLIIAIAAFKIAFYKESIINILRIILSSYWLFILPGYAILLKFKENFEFSVRFILGTVLGLGIYGVFSYYLGLVGINVHYHWMIIPTAIIAVMALIILIKQKNCLSKTNNNSET